MLEYAGLSSRHADRQRLAVCHAKLDDIGAVGLRTVDHNAVLAARWNHAHLRRSRRLRQPTIAEQLRFMSTLTKKGPPFSSGDPRPARAGNRLRSLTPLTG